jgi:GDP-4-dehydro-6-deoxy-D-mannose reductase
MRSSVASVLVTGSSGFIGRHLVPALRHEGYTVHAIGDEHDITKPWTEFPKADAVVHLAGISSVRRGEGDPLPVQHANVTGTLEALNYCRMHKAKLIFPSTAGVYGVPQYLPIKETHPLQPGSAYASSKVMAEEKIRESGVSSIILRFANIYGTGQSKDFLIPTIISQLKSGKVQIGNATSRREFLYVDDAVAAVIAALRSDEQGTFNIGTGRSTSVEEIIHMLRDINGHFDVAYDDSHKSNVLDIYFDCSLAYEKLGWKAGIGVKEGLRKTLEEGY